MPKTILVAALFVVVGVSLRAQGRVVTGVALDTSCAPLPGVTIRIAGAKPVVTDAKGHFGVGGLDGIQVALRAELQGFRPVERVSEPWDGQRVFERVFLVPAGLVEVLPIINGTQRVVTPRDLEPRRLHGRVLDESCRPLPNATVRLVRQNVEVPTDRNGRFEFIEMTDGTYTIEVTAAGFIPTAIRDFAIDENNSGEITIALDRGQPHESVTILPR